jgi:hypothetical protein
MQTRKEIKRGGKTNTKGQTVLKVYVNMSKAGATSEIRIQKCSLALSGRGSCMTLARG